ncbi:MAG: 1-acyl-sn-glycerol-3-phosphate acyltransferase [Sulfuritalea sp.]|nr:1-acyl-sn-glycerol-3-phosphate acyltransferase [Sulfuritalea sp.]MDP1981052.1 1-acyl-sn-glycerol-3-phosphate acyltransferase [Sulfuritalea sp.]
MTATVAVPLWVLVILVGFAGWAVLVLLLVPGMRWFFRRRIKLVLRQIGERLSIELPSFALTRRQVLIDRLFHDHRVQAAAAAHAMVSKEAMSDVWRRIDRYAREIVPSFNAYVYYRIGYALARAAARALYRVRIGFVDEEALARIDPKSTIVFVINHRSNMDYVLVAFLAAERTTLSFAVGEWARIWPLQQLIRAMGAYFVRRNSGDPLYRTVLSRYVQMASEAGVTQAVFPEGGLTVDGHLRPPKFGLLDYMLKTFDERVDDGRRDLVFIPVGLNYDRVLEDRSQLLKLNRGAPRTGRLRGLGITAGFLVRNFIQLLGGGWHRFGYACVNFGTPLSMRAYARERGVHFPALDDTQRRAEVGLVAARLMSAIGQVIPVLPVSLIASILARDLSRAWSEMELKAAAHASMQELEGCGAHLYIPRHDHDYAFAVGLRMLTLRRIVREEGGLFRPVVEEAATLNYYANAIAHLGADAVAPIDQPLDGGQNK